jgi:hypothetical protein
VVSKQSIQKWVDDRKGFTLDAEHGDVVLRGSLEVLDGVNYDVHITFPGYPQQFPKVKEVSNKIPHDPNRHVNPDGTLCLAVRPQEVLLCRKGLTFDHFMNQILVPHLAREYVKSETGEYPQGEYSHGNKGVLEFFQERFGQENKETIIQLIDLAIQPNGTKMYDECVCGSGRKFKFCHYPVCLELREMGKETLKSFNETMKLI